MWLFAPQTDRRSPDTPRDTTRAPAAPRIRPSATPPGLKEHKRSVSRSKSCASAEFHSGTWWHDGLCEARSCGRRHRVAVDVVFLSFDGQRVGQTQQTQFGRAVVGLSEVPVDARRGRRHDDPANRHQDKTITRSGERVKLGRTLYLPNFWFFMWFHAALVTRNEPLRCTR